MARTSSAAVIAILISNKNYDGSTSLDSYIETATDVVTQVNTCATTKGVTLTSTTLELIERWLSAHYYTIMDPLYKSKSTLKASGSFNDRSYADVAKQLDSSGCLTAILEGNNRAQVVWLGKPPSSQINYADRD